MSIHLAEQELESIQIKRLAHSLKKNNTITHIDLLDNNIGDEGAQHVAEFLVSADPRAAAIAGRTDAFRAGYAALTDAAPDLRKLFERSPDSEEGLLALE